MGKHSNKGANTRDWYTPLGTDGGEMQILEPPPRRKRHIWGKIIALTVCIALVCASVYVAAVHTKKTAELYGFMEPAAAEEPESTDSGEAENVYEDYRDYFASYYSTSSEISMPKVEPGSGRTLQLTPSRGQTLDLTEVYEKVSPAVVGITTYVDEESFSWGTGVVFSPDGYIITNTHILQGCEAASVVFSDGQEYEARLVGADEVSDIAVILLEGAEDLPFAEFGSSASLRVGQAVCAIGNPLNEDYSRTMTDGIISAIDRNVTYEGHTMTLLQTNAALNEGNSGGPLVNEEGQVIGITNMKIMSSYLSTVEGIGFAIPSAVVKEVSDQLIAQGYVSGEPTIGIMAGSVSEEARSLYGLPDGLYVSSVQEGSDALEKGLQEGDVITAVNGIPVNSVAQVNEIKEELEVGDTMDFTVYRDGEELEMTIALVDKGDVQ